MRRSDLVVIAKPSRGAVAIFTGFAISMSVLVYYSIWKGAGMTRVTADETGMTVATLLWFGAGTVLSLVALCLLARAATQAAGAVPVATLCRVGNDVYIFRPSWGHKRVVEGSMDAVIDRLQSMRGKPMALATNPFGFSYLFKFELDGEVLFYSTSDQITVQAR